MAGSARVMVATNAFGLGIDKRDTRFVVHYQMPAGLDAYYQESGRAGRDGGDADCTLLFLHSDRAVQQFFLAGRYPAKEDVADLYGALQQRPDDGGAWTLDRLHDAIARPKAKLQVALRLLRHRGVVGQSATARSCRRAPASTRRAREAARVVSGEARTRPRDARADGLLRPDRTLPLEGAARELRRRRRLRALRDVRQLRPHRRGVRCRRARADADRDAAPTHRRRGDASATPRCRQPASSSPCRATAAASSRRSAPRA
jgi:ATP-dependent DNA helicase RecQ